MELGVPSLLSDPRVNAQVPHRLLAAEQVVAAHHRLDSRGFHGVRLLAQVVHLQDAVFLRLAGVRDEVRPILDSARLENFFLIFPSVDEALAAP